MKTYAVICKNLTLKCKEDYEWYENNVWKKYPNSKYAKMFWNQDWFIEIGKDIRIYYLKENLQNKTIEIIGGIEDLFRKDR